MTSRCCGSNCRGTGGFEAEGKRGDEKLLALLESMLSVDPMARPGCGEVLSVLDGAARGKEGNKKRSKRRQREEADDKGVSLALYRPAALPPLPPTAVGANRRPISTIATRIQTLPAHPTAIAIALLKTLSASLLFTTTPLAPIDPLYTAILLLALIDLSNAHHDAEGIRLVSIACWAGHVGLLLAMYLYRG